MIRSLRVRHRAMILVLALALPLGVAAGLLARRPIPEGALPAVLAREASPLASVLVDRDDLCPGVPVRVRLAAGGVAELRPLEELRQPEVLIYWSAAPGAGQALPGDATLVGTLRGRGSTRFTLPPAAADGSGILTLYRLAQGEVLSTCALP